MLFKSRRQFPRLRNTQSIQRKKAQTRRGGRYPHLPSQLSRSKTKRSVHSWKVIVAVSAVAAILISAPAWLPTIRWFVPDRYIMAYAPPRLQKTIFRINIDEQVPTPSAYDEALAQSLLTLVAPTPTPTPSPDEEVIAVPAGGYVQPTPVPGAPTPTVTPAVAMAISTSAVDLEHQADLSHADTLLTGFTFHQQTGSNNCGPASFATMISYWGTEMTMEEAAITLKPNAKDPNVRPDEMAALAESLGYHMIIREGGSFDTIKQFLLAGYPVLIETGYDPEPETIGWTSHYLTLVGYSDKDQGFIAMDTYRRPNWFYSYEALDHYWRQFNRRYLIAYRSDQAVAVASIIGENMDDDTMYRNAIETAQAEININRNDAFAWFNLGTNLVGLERYEDAAVAFDEARRLGLPWRFTWYQFAPFEAYMQVGRYDAVIDMANAVIAKIGSEEPYYYLGLAQREQGKINDALKSLDMALYYNKNFKPAEEAYLALNALQE